MDEPDLKEPIDASLQADDRSSASAKVSNQQQILNIIRYWRNSLADADKIGLSPEKMKKGEQFSLDIFKNGNLPSHQIKYFFDEAEKQLKQKKKKWGENKDNKVEVLENEVIINKLQVIIAPYTANKNYEHGKKVGQDKCPNEVFPLWLVASLTRDGKLIPSEENTYPWIERRCLTPNEEHYVYPIIGDVAQIDEFYIQNKSLFTEGNITWDAFFSFALSLFRTILDDSNKNKFSEQNYTLKECGYILPLDDSQGLSKAIIKLYDQVLVDKAKKIPSLLKDFCSLEARKHCDNKPDEALFVASMHHLGQMQAQYPLSASQRISLSYFFDYDESNIFTVHGPPGTGKTSLLLSVIASKWVEAAIQQVPPPIIVAASTNNLAVTNILDQFSAIGGDDLGDFSKRWLPGFNSFGLYLAPSHKAATAEKNNYLFRTKKNGEGNIDKFYLATYQELARANFLQNFNFFFKKAETDLLCCKNYIHQQLVEKKQLLVNSIELSHKYRCAQIELNKLYGNLKIVNELIDQNANKKTAILNTEKDLKDLRTDWFLYKSNQLKWLICFAWLPFVKPLLIDKIKFYTSKNHKIFSDMLGDVNAVDKFFDEKIAELTLVGKQVNKQLTELQIIKNSSEQFIKDKKKLQEQLGFDWSIKNLFSFSDSKSLLAKLDQTLRYQLFLLATHYWEVTWLIEKNIIETLAYDINGRRKYWEIQAMLMPCFVTTLHSGPGFFQYKTFSQEFEALTDFIDLLIIDEAGQVMPAVAGAMIATAKRALLVGDTKQIEPIFTLTESIDLANTKKFRICNDSQDYDQLKYLGVLCSGDVATAHAHGNVITVGQRKAKFHLQEQKLPGMLLKEHRRCAKIIISYCNELCYDNQLIPMTEEKECIFPRMGYAHIKGYEEKIGSSRSNKLEAQAIVSWLVKNRNKILKTCEKESLDECVGIVTPFAAQGNIIRAALYGCDLEINKVGTIHSLQGAQKPIIIFSSVYSANEQQGTFFFDKAPNMLNVAVSRAQMAFLVFGDIDIFEQLKSNRPSSLLAQYLFASEFNEIVDVIQPKFNEIVDEGIQQINSLEKHRHVLKKSFLRTKSELNIVSPFLRIAAIECDSIIELVACYSVDFTINVYADPSLNKNCYNEFMQAKKMLEAAGATVFLVNNVHSKIIAIDDRVIIEGSFNWLSASRLVSQYIREESSIIYTGKHVSRFIQEAMNPIKSKVKKSNFSDKNTVGVCD